MCRINPRVDFAFKKLFGSEDNKELLISFINSVVSEKDRVKEIELRNPYNEKSFKNDKLSVLDIKAKDEKGNWFNIEMQIIDQEYYDRRALYYWSKLYTGQLISGINYDNLKKTISINILNFNALNESTYHNTYKLLNLDTKQELSDHLEIHFIELEKYDKDLTEITTMLDKWTTFLKKAAEYNKEKIPKQLAEVETIKRAVEVLETMSLSDDEREVYEARLKWLRDEEMALKSAEKKGIEKGFQIGIEKGIEKGFQVGRENGLKEGIEKGLKKGKLEDAKKMLLKGISIPDIADITDLEESEIENLKKEMN